MYCKSSRVQRTARAAQEVTGQKMTELGYHLGPQAGNGEGEEIRNKDHKEKDILNQKIYLISWISWSPPNVKWEYLTGNIWLQEKSREKLPLREDDEEKKAEKDMKQLK